MSKFSPGRHTWGEDSPSGDVSARQSKAWTCAFERILPISLHEVITSWDADRRQQLFRILLPIDRLVEFGIDPIDLADAEERPIARLAFDASQSGVRIELYHRGDAADAMMEFELRDTPFNQIEVVWLAIQDPLAQRFDVDRMPDGQSTLRGATLRNFQAEADALAHGLAPGQILPGLHGFSQAVTRMETFMFCLGQREYIAQPLYYHSAVMFERAGFSYLQGRALMERIHAGFSADGGDLRSRLDSTSPFRRPELADSVRGRAWAIHDGILGEEWNRVRMVKRLGVDAKVDTCPGLPW
jgi:hypothetical protein